MQDCDLSRYDVAFAPHLSPVLTDALWNMSKDEMRPGSLFINNTSSMRDHPPQESISVDDLHHSTLYLWRI